MCTLVSHFLACTVLLASTLGQAPIEGSFQDCPFHCRTIKINADGTFIYHLNGDLYNNQSYRGQWRRVSGNLIHATSPEDTSPPRVIERTGTDQARLRIRVGDEHGAVFGGIDITCTNGVEEMRATTDDAGRVVFPRCQEIMIRSSGYRGTYTVASPQTTELDVILTPQQMDAWAIDEYWLIDGDRLYPAEADGSIDKDRWLRRLRPREERKVFRLSK